MLSEGLQSTEGDRTNTDENMLKTIKEAGHSGVRFKGKQGNV